MCASILSGGCCSTGNSENTGSLTKLTEMQKFMAEKAVKLPGDNNPLAIHKFTADPCVLIYEDTVYIYGTNDFQQAEYSKGNEDNAFNKINTLNVFSSKDLVNWTDCGEIAVAGKQNPKGAAKWATHSWAPAICHKKVNGKEKFFLYFADNGSGIGVLSADSPLGPFVDPIGKPLVSRAEPNIGGVHWLFDPAVIVDDDGKGYLYFGGGVKDDPEHPKSARCVALSDDMISIVGIPAEIDAPWLFEDSGINKFGDTFYYSYCSNWDDRTGAKGDDVLPIAVIAYMTSKNPLGPFTFKGYTLENPGKYFGPWGNNHHWIFDFNGKHYIAYHTQTTEKQIGFTKVGYRSIFINDFIVNDDGSLPIQKASKEGVAQVKPFDVYREVPAATFQTSHNLAVTSVQTLIPVAASGWLCVKGCDLAEGNATVTIKAKEGSKGTVKFLTDNWSNGTELASVEISSAVTEKNITVTDGGNKDIYIVISGDVELISWEIKK